MKPDWHPDILGAGFEAASLTLRPDDEGDLCATLIRHRPSSTDRQARDATDPIRGPSARAALYLHGFNDYFFHQELAGWFADRGLDFYALDLRRHGRSLRPGQTENYCGALTEYDEELDLATDAILAAGHRRLVIVAHSTGGLIASLWAARRRGLPLDGLLLNSPFLEFKQPAVVRAVVGRTASAAARRRPLQALPGGVDSCYGDSLHVDRRGDWDYNLDWKPSPGFPVRLGWLRAIVEGHRILHAGLDLRPPVLVMSSTRTTTTRVWHDDLRRGDSVLDADAIARWAPAIGRHVTIVRIEDGMHDLVLSPRPARDRAYDAMATWLSAWVV